MKYHGINLAGKAKVNEMYLFSNAVGNTALKPRSQNKKEEGPGKKTVRRGSGMYIFSECVGFSGDS